MYRLMPVFWFEYIIWVDVVEFVNQFQKSCKINYLDDHGKFQYFFHPHYKSYLIWFYNIPPNIAAFLL